MDPISYDPGAMYALSMQRLQADVDRAAARRLAREARSAARATRTASVRPRLGRLTVTAVVQRLRLAH